MGCMVGGLVTLLVSAGCDGGEASRQRAASTDKVAGKVVLSGATTVSPLMADIAKRFQESQPELQVEVRPGGSSVGIADARQGQVDIGMSSRMLHDEERDLHSFPIARDGVCILINKENPVDGLNRQQLVDIFTGKVTNWKEVGGKDAPIVVFDRAQGRSEVELITHYLKIKPADIKSQAKLGDNPDVIQAVANSPNAITYMSLGHAYGEAKGGKPLKLVAVEGVAATPVAVGTGAYPITRPLILVTRGLPSGAAKRLIDYSLSNKIRDLVQAHGFIPYLD